LPAVDRIVATASWKRESHQLLNADCDIRDEAINVILNVRDVLRATADRFDDRYDEVEWRAYIRVRREPILGRVFVKPLRNRATVGEHPQLRSDLAEERRISGLETPHRSNGNIAIINGEPLLQLNAELAHVSTLAHCSDSAERSLRSRSRMNAVDGYAEIERKAGFRIPELYRRMLADGALDYPPGAMFGELRRGLYEQQPALSCALDVEWLPLEAIVGWEPPDFWLPEKLLVPFAVTGAGDHYAWYPAWADGADVPIVLAWHDDNRCDVLAPNLEGFMYRQTLSAMTFEPASPSPSGGAHEERRRGLRKDLDTLRPYLPAKWMQDLELLYATEPRIWKKQFRLTESVYLARLNEHEFEERVARELRFPHLNEAFPHMKPYP
jgi:hypothetical protein